MDERERERERDRERERERESEEEGETGPGTEKGRDGEREKRVVLYKCCKFGVHDASILCYNCNPPFFHTSLIH